MSIAAMNWALSMIAAGRAGSTSTKLVLMQLANRADPEGICWPGHEKTASDLDLGERTVAEAIKTLKGNGLLQVERRTDLAGRDLPNRYHLCINLVPPPPRRGKLTGADSAGGVADPATRGAKPAGRSAQPAPETKALNRSSKPKKAVAPEQVEAAAAFPLQGKKGRRRASGIVTWDPDDLQYAGRVEAEFPSDVLAEAVTRVSARKNLRGNPTSPTPYLIEEEARRVVRERLAREQERAKRERHERAYMEAAKKPKFDLAAYQAALERAGSFRDVVLHSTYQAYGTPEAWVPRPEWGLSDADVAAIRVGIPDRRLDPP